MANQLINPNPDIPCTPGMCLVYVRETFGIGPKYPTAAAGWGASTYKHEDQDFPADVWFPLWFKMKGDSGGHVVLRQPDGSIWSASDPTATKPVHHPSLDDLENYYGGRLTYLGWTSDIEGVPVIEVTTAGIIGGPGGRVGAALVVADGAILTSDANDVHIVSPGSPGTGGHGGYGGDMGNGNDS